MGHAAQPCSAEPGTTASSLLLTTLYVLVLGFALLYAITDAADPAAFAGMETRTDSLYFSVTTMATVGFGDVHAAGPVARVMVTVQMVFQPHLPRDSAAGPHEPHHAAGALTARRSRVRSGQGRR